MKSRKITVTTTSSLEGSPVQAYLGVVSAHVVAGTGLFSDMFASFSDVFGGRSRSYQNQLAAINKEVIDELRESALALGANAVVGLRIDHDEISGTGKSMFMVTAIGTAVKVDAAAVSASPSPSAISGDEVAISVERNRLIAAAEEGSFNFVDETWAFLCEHEVHEVAPLILAVVEENYHLRENCKAYFRCLPSERAHHYLYEALEKGGRNHKFVLNLLTELRLVDYGAVRRSLSSDKLAWQKLGLKLLLIDKASYRQDDIEQLKELRAEVEATFVNRSQEMDKSRTFSSKTKKMWVCECGQKNDLELVYCAKCGHDAYGFKHAETHPDEVFALLSDRIAVLETYFATSHDHSRF